MEKENKLWLEKFKSILKNKKIMAITTTVLFLFIVVIVILLTTKNNTERETNNENNDIAVSNLNNTTFEETIENNKQGQSENQNKNYVMPNLVGMDYKHLRDYLNNNNLSFITKINNKYNSEVNNSSYSTIPLHVLATIPEAGTTLDPYTDTSITVCTDYGIEIKEVIINFQTEKDWKTKYFGKTLKIQVGNNENNIIEGIIGSDFKFNDKGNIEYSRLSKVNRENVWDYIQGKEITLISNDDITIDSSLEKYVNLKMFINGDLIKESTCIFRAERIIINI